MVQFLIPPPPPTVLAVAGGGLFAVRRVFAVAQNYAAHAREMGGDPDRQPPFFFTKPADAVTSADSIPYPPATKRLDYEGELVVALAHGGADIAVADALSHVFGYAVGCDLTRRDLQAEARQSGRPWDMAKGFDASAVCGALQPVGIIGHPLQNAITLDVNGVRRQDGNTNQMIWSVAEIIAELSRYVTLATGDVIYSGTPAGIGALERGDVVEMAIADVGSHRFTMV